MSPLLLRFAIAKAKQNGRGEFNPALIFVIMLDL